MIQDPSQFNKLEYLLNNNIINWNKIIKYYVSRE